MLKLLSGVPGWGLIRVVGRGDSGNVGDFLGVGEGIEAQTSPGGRDEEEAPSGARLFPQV